MELGIETRALIEKIMDNVLLYVDKIVKLYFNPESKKQLHIQKESDFVPNITEYNHQQTHLQTHLDKWSSNLKPDKVSWKPPESMTQDLFMIFEKYRLGERAILCLWANGQLNTANRKPARILELQDRLKEWLAEG